jgi:hypothetical protein
MLNLLVSYSEDSWDYGSYTIEKSRFCEHTRQDIREFYLDFHQNETKKKDLLSYPCLFVVENEAKESRIGSITELIEDGKNIVIKFQFDTNFVPIPKGKVRELMKHLDIGKWELSRTHWAIKDVNAINVLLTYGFSSGAPLPIETKNIPIPSNRNVFIVHGHDSLMRNDVKEFLANELNLVPIILSEVPSNGMTIMEKLERYASQGFAVVLYSPCDIGGKKSDLPLLSFRARQNVVFEHGYLIGKLGRNKVVALKKGDVETPGDMDGVVYIKYEEEGWKEILRKEFSSPENTFK